MKYVILKIKISDGVHKAFPVIFAEHLTHSEVAVGMTRVIRRETTHNPEVHSAGFCGWGMNGFVCTRGSETLQIPRENERSAEDERLITLNTSTSGMMF